MDSELETQFLLREGICVEVARTPATLREAQALRHQVFCLERGIFAPAAGQALEEDEFDHRAQHIVLRRCDDRAVIATTRVVTASEHNGHARLPMQRYCCPSLFRDLDMDGLGEVSRFAISKQARGTSNALLRLGLLRGILLVSQTSGLTHWCALMEPSLLRLLRGTGVHFAHLGELVEAYGLRRPCIARIDLTLARCKRARPDFFDMIVGAHTTHPQRGASTCVA